MPVKAKYIKDLPLKKVLDGSESLLVQDLNGTQQAPLGTIVDEIKQNSQEKIREIESELAQTNAQLSQKASESALDVERKRIDSFTKLQDGSTTGDAELIDGRVGADAIVYDNIGEAVRTQFTNKINEIELKTNLIQGGYIHYSTGNVNTHASLYYSDFIEVFNTTENVTIKNLNYKYNDAAGMAFYDINKDYISGYQYNNETDLTIELPLNTKYIRFTVQKHSQFNNVIVYQNQYDIVKNVYENSKNVKKEVALNFTDDKYITSNGSLISNSRYKIATIVEYDKAGRYEIVGRVGDLARLYAVYDKNGVAVKVFPENSGNIKNSLYSDVVDVQIGYKLVVCCFNSEISVVNIPINEVTNEFVDVVNSEVGIGEVTHDTVQEGRYVGKSGNFITITGTNFTSIELSVFSNQRFKIQGTCDSGQRLYSLVDKKGNVVKVFPDEPGDIRAKKYSDIVTIPKDVVKLRVCSYRDAEKNITQLPILSHPIELEDFSYLNHLVSDVLCIGDSLTRGAYYSPEHNGTSIKESYPYFLGKINNWTVTNAGRSGWYSTKWYKEERRNYDFSLYDSFIIWLGTNKGYTDTLEDDTNATSYQDYADTETGNLCKIIEDIKENRPKANIFLLNLFSCSGNLATSNSVIEQIGEKYGIPVFNMNDGSIYNCEEHDVLHPFGNNVHFGKVGNITVANKISKYITGYIKENKSQFEQLYIK